VEEALLDISPHCFRRGVGAKSTHEISCRFFRPSWRGGKIEVPGGSEQGFAPHRVKRTAPNAVLGQAGCTVSLRPKTTALQALDSTPRAWRQGLCAGRGVPGPAHSAVRARHHQHGGHGRYRERGAKAQRKRGRGRLLGHLCWPAPQIAGPRRASDCLGACHAPWQPSKQPMCAH
jgi:hypothetical protein